jgi:predicted Zn-dependent protease with MMP-like domain
MDRKRFESLVEEALDSFPEEFQRLLDNLAVIVEDMASPQLASELGIEHPMQLLGLYTGVPYTQWGRGYYQGPPDTIRLYRLPILSDAHTPEEVKERVREVILHEVGHRAGMGEERLRELGVG